MAQKALISFTGWYFHAVSGLLGCCWQMENWEVFVEPKTPIKMHMKPAKECEWISKELAPGKWKEGWLTLQSLHDSTRNYFSLNAYVGIPLEGRNGRQRNLSGISYSICKLSPVTTGGMRSGKIRRHFCGELTGLDDWIWTSKGKTGLNRILIPGLIIRQIRIGGLSLPVSGQSYDSPWNRTEPVQWVVNLCIVTGFILRKGPYTWFNALLII